MIKVALKSETDTEELARELVKILRPGESIGLSGDLGAGKTTFVRYAIGAMGGDIQEVSSPSYTLQHEYRLPAGLVVEHWDLYRLTELPEELREPASSRSIRFLEWPERCVGLSQDLDFHCRFTLLVDGSREVLITGVDNDLRLVSIGARGRS
jgi:tRNA threonylcarbamoyl adenosine modification protein YjeE